MVPPVGHSVAVESAAVFPARHAPWTPRLSLDSNQRSFRTSANERESNPHYCGAGRFPPMDRINRGLGNRLHPILPGAVGRVHQAFPGGA